MKKNICILIVISFYVLVFNSCKKQECNAINEGNISFTQADINFVPYNNSTKTLIFLDSLGNSINYSLSGSASSWWTTYYAGSTIDGCMGNYVNCQNYGINLKTKDSTGQINISIGFDNNPFSTNLKNPTKSIGIIVEYVKSQDWYFAGSFNFDDSKLYNYNPKIWNIFAFDDSLKVGRKEFYSVYILQDFNNFKYRTVTIPLVYYTIKNGVVGFKTNNGHLWYLSN